MCIDPVSITAMVKTAAASVGSFFSGATGAAGAASSGLNFAKALKIGSGVASAIGGYTSARAQSAAASANAEAQNEAARLSLERGTEEANLQRRRAAAQISKNRAAMAANGLDVGGELATSLLSQQEIFAEEDALAIRENARQRASNFAVQASNSALDARMARTASITQPLGTLLTTASQVGRRYNEYT